MTRRTRRRVILAASAGVILTLTGFAVWPIASGHTTPPEFSRKAAERALDQARTGGAGKWAPQALERAEVLLREAWTEVRRQDAKIVFLRDYRTARVKLQTAESAARWAAESAAEAHDHAAAGAEDALEQAERLLDETTDFLDACRFGPGPSALLRMARIHLGEAEAYRRHSEHGLARLRAEQVVLEVKRAREQMKGAVQRFIDPNNVQRWRNWTQETVAWSRRTGQPAIVVNKDEASLTLFVGGRPVRRYEAEIGRNHLQPKRRAGDAATPEGRYNVISKKRKGQSKYHAALELDYPNAEDLSSFKRSKANGELRANDRPGALIEIHGSGGRGWDWTDGCVAVRNDEVEQLMARVALGTPVTIIGSDGNGGRFSSIARRLSSGDRGDRHDP